MQRISRRTQGAVPYQLPTIFIMTIKVDNNILLNRLHCSMITVNKTGSGGGSSKFLRGTGMNIIGVKGSYPLENSSSFGPFVYCLFAILDFSFVYFSLLFFFLWILGWGRSPCFRRLCNSQQTQLRNRLKIWERFLRGYLYLLIT